MTQESMPRRRFIGGMAGVAAAGLGGRAAGAQTGGTAGPALPSAAPADVILRNGKVITVDRSNTITRAVAVVGDRILAVGPDEAIAAHTGAATRVIDLKGKTVIPGLVDGHAHMDREALRAVFPSLGHVRSIRDIQDRIAELARGKRPGEWIVTMPIGDPPYYFGLPEMLAEKRWPTRHDLDAAAPEQSGLYPLDLGLLARLVPLVSCANTEALQRAGITRDTVSPVDTLTIEKDANGDPTGVFVEQEMQPIAELIWFRQPTGFTHADRVRALPESARIYHTFGTTSVFEGHGAATELIRAYQQCLQEGTLTMRATLVFSPDWPAAGNAPRAAFVNAWAGWLAGTGLGNDRLKMAGLHCGGGRVAADDLRATAAPYTGWAGFNYVDGLPRDELKEVLVAAPPTASGW